MPLFKGGTQGKRKPPNMAEGKNSFLFYSDWKDIFSELKDADAGRLIKHICAYVNDENPIEPTGVIKMALIPIKAQLKRDLKKWESASERNSKIAKSRWEKVRENANALNGKKENAKNADTVTDTDTVTDNVTVTVTDTKKKAIEIFFNDLENSQHLETIAEKNNLSVDQVRIFIPKFRVKSDLDYPNYNRFINHFKNFVNKELNEKSTTKNNDRVSKQESLGRLEELAYKMLRAGNGDDS